MESINFLNGISNKKSTWSGLLYLMKTCKYQCFNKYILREEKNIQTIQTLYYASNFALKENAAQIIAQWLQNIYIVPLNVNVNVSLLPFFQGSLRLLPLNYLLMDLKEFELVIVIQLKCNLYRSILFKTNCQVSAKPMGGFEIFLIIKFENTNQLCWAFKATPQCN